jgi:uncharacterized protein with GYD domain
VSITSEKSGSAGVELKEIYWAQGPYDLIAIIEAPDDESIAAAMLGIAAHRSPAPQMGTKSASLLPNQ